MMTAPEIKPRVLSHGDMWHMFATITMSNDSGDRSCGDAFAISENL
jgi:hypothetical protein